MALPSLSLSLLGRVVRMPPRKVLARLARVGREFLQRRSANSVHLRWEADQILAWAGVADLEDLWLRLCLAPFPPGPDVAMRVVNHCPEEAARLRILAERACRRQVDLLGSGPVVLPSPIPWTLDFKSGFQWPPAYCHDISYSDLGKPNDVKIPWEMSRLHWLLPAAQMFAIEGGENWAEVVAATVESWIDANPYAWTVNWSCTMDVALRAMAIIWMLTLTARAKSWTDVRKRKVLKCLYGHGYFISRNLEGSDVNGNHFLADAAGLVFCGLFFQGIGEARDWAEQGRRLLDEEIPLQIYPDGVDHEASIPYHRLVLELLLLPALFLEVRGFGLGGEGREALRRMAQFVADYSGPDGRCPRLGDADDGRGIALGGQPLDDHRYLCHLVGAWLEDQALLAAAGGPWAEAAWWLGGRAFPAPWPDQEARCSALYADGGILVLRNATTHLVADVGPLGLRGRGGHGQNDATGFELWLGGERIVADRGAWVYTADFQGRNEFRMTGSHSVIQLDDEEMNRLVDPLNLWQLRDDARPEVVAGDLAAATPWLKAIHHGYKRHGVDVSRTWSLLPEGLKIVDEVRGATRVFRSRIWLAEGVETERLGPASLRLGREGGPCHRLDWDGAGCLVIQERDLSPSYGVRLPCLCLGWEWQHPEPEERMLFHFRAGHPC